MAAVSIAPPAAENALSAPELISRIHSGDQRAFEALFKAHYSELCQFVGNYVDRATGEEVIQDVFLAIWRRRKDWNPPGEIRSYLFAAARNQAISAIRKNRSSAHLIELCAAEGTIPGASQSGQTPLQHFTAGEIEAACRRAIHELPEIQRIAMVLRWQYGMSHAKIAFILGTSVKAVEHHMTKGLRTLAKRLAWLRI